MTRENHPEGLKVSYDLAHDVMHSQPLVLIFVFVKGSPNIWGKNNSFFPPFFLTICGGKHFTFETKIDSKSLQLKTSFRIGIVLFVNL